MIVHPVLDATRRDETPLRQAQAVMADAARYWTESEGAILADLAALDAGAPLEQRSALAELFTGDGAAARAFAARFVAAQAEALARTPLGQVTHRHHTDGTASTLSLGRTGGVTLTIVAIDGAALAARPAAVSCTYSPMQCWDRVLAGSADSETVTCTPTGPDSAAIAIAPVALRPGTIITRDARRTALLWRRVHGRLVVLSLQRRTATTEPVREYRLSDGKLIHAAATNPRQSRQEMMVSLLGAMGRADASPLLAEIAREPGAPSVRWQALREGLGLDTRTGFLALDAVARDLADPLAEAAATLRAHLTETYPQLRELA